MAQKKLVNFFEFIKINLYSANIWQEVTKMPAK